MKPTALIAIFVEFSNKHHNSGESKLFIIISFC
jgi:hypothetical protein